MTSDSEFLSDVWAAIKPYLNPKEKFDAALQLVEVFDDHGFTDGLEDDTFDRTLQKAIKEHFGIEDEEKSDD
jgi:hypothetical protein